MVSFTVSTQQHGELRLQIMLPQQLCRATQAVGVGCCSDIHPLNELWLVYNDMVPSRRRAMLWLTS